MKIGISRVNRDTLKVISIKSKGKSEMNEQKSFRKKKNEKVGQGFFKENFYAVKTIWKISPSRIIFDIFRVTCDYAVWLFSSVYFLRIIIEGIEGNRTFSSLMGFVLFMAVIFAVVDLFYSYSTNVVRPLTGNTIKKVLYARLYKKACNVELGCYEDTEFYDKYTMALENAGTRIPETVETFIHIAGGLIASIAAFYIMFTIDPFAVFFIISPIVGNGLIGASLSKIEASRYQETTPHNRKIAYVKRVLYLAEFAKEVRLSKIYPMMMKRYDEGVGGIKDVANKFALKGTVFLAVKNILTFAFVFQGIMLYAAYRALVSQTLGLADMTIIFSAMVTTSWIFIGLFGNISESLKHVVFIKGISKNSV